VASPPLVSPSPLSRRSLLGLLGFAGGTLALGGMASSADAAQEHSAIPSFTGPGANSYWNSVGPFVSEPQKAPLLLLTDRGVQLETPRSYFQTAITPNDAFYVRWHLRLRELLRAAAPKSGSVQVQFRGLETGVGPEGYGSQSFAVAFQQAASSGYSFLKETSTPK